MQSRPDAREPLLQPGTAFNTWTPAEAADALPSLVAQAYDQADLALRAQVLSCLLRPFGPLALAGVASGAFGGILQRAQGQGLAVSLDDAQPYNAEQVRELASFAFQIDPGVLLQLDQLLTDHPHARPPQGVDMASLDDDELLTLEAARQVQ